MNIQRIACTFEMLGYRSNSFYFSKAYFCHLKTRPIATMNILNKRCFCCELHQISRGRFPFNALKNKQFLTFQQTMQTVRFGTVPKADQPLTIDESSSPQGLQGDIKDDSAILKMWLENCHRYGLSNCDQLLKDVQSGKKTISQVMAEQESLRAEIAEEYQKHHATSISIQGAQDAVRLPDINTPSPQGIQGEDCARFKMWLENCNQFRFSNCVDQLEGFTLGRTTLPELFESQDKMIREAATVAYQRRMRHTSQATTEKDGQNQAETAENDGAKEEVDPGQLTSRQKLKNAVKVYGSTVIVFHVSISLASLGFFYMLVSNGIDVVGLLSRLGIGESIIQSKLATGTGTFVVAYAVHKVFAPARIAATLTATPLIVRYLRRVGFLKTPVKK